MTHKPIYVLTLSFLVSLYTLFLPSHSHADSDNAALTPINLQLRWFHQFQFAGYYIAKELGYYAEAGLDVEITQGSPGIDPVTEVTSGRADFGVDNSGLIWARSEGKPVKAIAAIFQKSALRFISLGNDQINPESLKGEKVMLLPDYGSLVLIALLKQEQLLDQIVRVDSTHNIHDLIEHNTFAFNGYASNEPFTLENNNIPYVEIDPADYGIKFYSDVLFTRDELSLTAPELVDSFKSATLKGWKHALAHPASAIEIVQKYAPSKSKNHLRFEANIVREHTISDYVEIGHMSHDRWLQIQNHLVNIGLINQRDVVTIDDFIHTPYSEPLNWRNSLGYLSTIVLVILLLVFGVLIYYRQSQRLQHQVVKARSKEEVLFKAATHDHLTGLPNRMLLFDRLEIALADTKRTGINTVVAFIDLDKFKHVNDHFGHHKGDEILKSIATHMNTEISPSDTLARYGGDEFIFLGRGLNQEQALTLAHQLIEAAGKSSINIELYENITASIGMIIINNTEHISASGVLKMADANMYAQKKLAPGGVNIEVID